MMRIIAPTYSLAAVTGAGSFTSAALMPAFEVELAAPTGGTPLEFAAADETQELPVPIPRLAGLDDIELDRVDFQVWSDAHLEDVTVGGSPANGQVVVSLTGPSASAASLESIEITDLVVTASASETFVLERNTGTGLIRVVYGWDADESISTVVPDGDPGASKHLHILVRPASNGGFGPPMAAAPHFAMPGAGGGLYGPALGGAALQLSKVSDTK